MPSSWLRVLDTCSLRLRLHATIIAFIRLSGATSESAKPAISLRAISACSAFSAMGEDTLSVIAIMVAPFPRAKSSASMVRFE